ncbi:murein biosynthesis integral membrane protein MurJ [Gammaproteobacteria bacterium]|nr:murein biosynthesis integral membrane protein MurJ [Gammaproteobacteria bacterium]
MSLAKSSFNTSVFTVFSKISGFLRDIFLAATIGTGVLSDIFFIALRIPISFKITLGEETFNSAYIPLFGKFNHTSIRQKHYQFAKKIILFGLFISIPLIVVVEIFMPNIISIFASNMNGQEEFNLLVKVSRIVFPYLIFIVISSVFVGTLNANHKFVLAAGLPIFLNGSLMFCIILFPFFNVDKIIILSYGVLLGGLAQSLLLFIAIDRKFWEVFFSTSKDYIDLKRFFNLLFPTFISSSITQLNLIIGMIIASLQPAAVSYLYYAERIYLLPLTVVGVAISTVLIPTLSNTIREGRLKTALAFQDKAYRYCIFIILPATFILLNFSDEIVTILYERGEFNSKSTEYTFKVLQIFILGLPAATIGKILIPYFFANEIPKIPLKANVISMIVNIFLTLILFQSIGFFAIPVAISISSWVNLILLLHEHKKLKFFLLTRTRIIYALKYLAISIAVSIIIIATDLFLHNLSIGKLSGMILELSFAIFALTIMIYKFDRESYNEIKSFIFNYLTTV